MKYNSFNSGFDILVHARNMGLIFILLNMIVFFWAAYSPFMDTLSLSSINVGYAAIVFLCVIILDIEGLREDIKEKKTEDLLKP